MPKRDNVIQFPGPKKPRPKPRPTLFVNPLQKHKLLHNKGFVCGLLICVLALSVWANSKKNQLFSYHEVKLKPRSSQAQPLQRGLASLSSGQNNNKKTIQRQLAAKSETVLGRRPSSIDHLQFGFLAGHYSLEYTGTQSTFVKSLKFVKKQGVFPVLVKDRKKFLTTHARLWPVQFDQVVLRERQLTGETLYENYALQIKGQPMAHVKFELDRLEHLLRLYIEVD